MKRNITLKETLAWIALVCAAFLFSVTIAFAQDQGKAKKGTTTIKIIKKENGKTTKIDTTFDSTDDAAVEKILRDLSPDHDMSFNFSFPELPATPGSKKRVMKFHRKGMSKEDRKSLREDMKNLDEEMQALHEKMKDIHIEIFSDKEGEEDSGYSFNFEMSPMPAMPEGDFDFSDEHCREFFRQHSSIPEAEELNDDDHVIISGDEGEAPPVFEKEVKGKNGEKAFIYKRSKPADKETGTDTPANDPAKLYPNPNDGKFSVTFNADKKDDLTINIYDSQGKKVYTESMKDFIGEYNNTIDLSSKKKGNYMLKITHGGKTLTEKFVIE